MSITFNPSAAADPGVGADVFLYLKTKRAGVVKGEGQSTNHLDEIVLSGWSWGVESSSALGHAAPTSRRSYTGLTVYKRIDLATTPLLSALATNDEVTEARLTMRRAGGDQEVFFVIVLKRARVASVRHEVGANGASSEVVTFRFSQVDVEYRPQKATGLRGGSMTFTDELDAGAA